MTKARKLVALMLAFLMIFSSASVFASAMSDSVDGGTALNISTKFFKEVDGEWIETTKVRPNDVVKARVYLGTDYYSGDSNLLFFYDKDFFTHSYAGQTALEMNTDAASFAATNNVSGYLVANANLQSQVDAGYITSAQLADYGVLAASVEIGGTETVMYDNSDWLFEITLTVAADASGEGDLFTVEELFQSTARTKAIGDVPKGEQGGNANEAWPMWVWDADISIASQPVSTISSVTFDANGGTFADGNATFGPIEGAIDSAIAADALPAAPNYAGYTFLGWVDAEIENPTENDIVAAPSVIPEEDLVLNAYWIKNVNITFANTGDSTIAPITNVTPNTEFQAVADPQKAGYTFVGWDVRGGELPDVYPTTDTTYTAVWALDVVVSFNTDGADEIAPVEGYEGAPFEATIADPDKEGHYFIGWTIDGGDGSLVDLPTVFPEKDVTYNAIFDTYTYYVTYKVKNLDTGVVKTYYLQAEYGSEVGFPVVNVPDGYEMDTQWYTDEACSVPFAAGTTMGTAPLTLYTTIDVETYKAYFMLEEGDEIADAYEAVDVAYGDDIPVPATNPTKEGFTFAGWTPYVGVLDVEEDVFFYATWEEEIHNVTYYMNDGSSDIHGAYDVPFGYDLEIPGDPTREGYTFIGWNTDADATTALAIDGTKMPNGSVEYYAVWEINQYTVTFDSNEGTAVDSKTQDYNSSVTAPTEPTRVGYKFVAWKDADDKAVTFPFDMPAENITLKAEWKLESYTLHFAETGDTVIDDIPVNYGDKIEAVKNPEKAGYKFLKWDVTPPTEIGDLGEDGATITYTAQWKQEEYTIRYAETGDTTIDDKIVNMGDTIEIPTGLKKDGQGLYFTGWDVTPPTAIGDMGNDGDVFTYTAQWTKETYTLKFADTDDDGTVITETVTYGDDFAAPANLTKTGHVFAGWDVTPPTKIGDMGENKASFTYTAQWTKETYIFHFTNTGDNAVADATVTYGDTYAAPTGLTKTGYNHVGWDPAVPTKIEDMGADKAEFTYAAQWEAKKINVNFDANTGVFEDGKTTKAVETEFDGDIKAPAVSKDGYAFVGWSTDPDATTGSNELGKLTTETPATYYAIWSANSANYTVEFWYMDVDGQGYTRADNETITDLAGVVDQPASYNAAEKITGFTLNADESNLAGTVPATGTLVLSVYYDRDQYNLTYEGNDAVKVYFGTAAADIPGAAKQPAKEGHYFVSWQAFPAATMPAADVEIAANWEKETYVFQFADTGDMAIDDATVTYGDTYEAPTGLTKVGHVFNGFAPVVPTTITDMGNDGDKFTYTAQWTPETYVFTFTNLYGNVVDDATVTYGDTYAAPTGLVRDGFLHTGWEPAVPTTIEDMGEDGETFEYAAKWTRQSYTVYFDKDNGEAVDEITRPFEAQIAEPSAPSKTGYDFSHWINTEDDSVVTFPFNVPAKNLNLKAIYTPKTYVLKFADTGDTPIADMPVTYGDTITVPTGLTKDGLGYVFTGWDETPPTEIGDMGATGTEFTYTAQWAKETYTLTFTETGDTAVADMPVTFGETITVPAGLTKDGQGLYFTGEWKDASGNVLTATIGDLGADKATVSYAAQWEKESYTLTFTNLFGNTVADMPVTYGDTIIVPTGLTRTGYNFKGWDPALAAAIGDLGDNGDTLSYAAVWEAKVINVTFDGNEGTIDGAATKVVPTTFDTAIVAPEAKRDGYAFVGWSTDPNATVGTTSLGNLTTETPATYYAIWNASAANYTVEFWYMNVNGQGYTKADKETITDLPGVVDQPVPTYKPATVTGFVLNTDKSVLDGNVPATGTLVLAVYYDRQQFKLNYEGAESYDVYFGTAAADMPTTSTVPTKEGHVFASWAALPATMPATAVDVAANWTAETYTVKFADTDDAGTVIEKPVTFGGTLEIPSGLTKTGHVFAGWTDANGNDATPSANVGDLGVNNAVITYTAKWTPETYTLKFTNLFGNTVADMPVTYGDTIIVPSGLTRTGYNFTGWDPTLETTIGDLGADKATVSYAATWEAKVINVTFDGNKGTIEGAATKVVPTTFDTDIVAPVANRDGYTFVGWSTNKDDTVGTNNLGKLTTETPATYYAIWSADGANYTVEFWEMNLDGTTYTKTGEDTTLTGVVDQPVDTYVPAAKTGFTVNKDMSVLDGTVPSTGTLVLKVYYDRASYKLIYKGAGSDHASYDVLYGTLAENMPVPATNPERTGYKFTVWATLPESMPANDVTIAANWEKETYTLTFADTGKTVIDDIPVTYGDTIDEVATPEKDGYKFLNWSPEVPTEIGDLGEDDAVIIYTAQWEIENYTLKFADTDDNGTVITKEVIFGDTIEVPSGLTKTGYVFADWDVTPPTEIGDLGVDDAVITYTAQWTKKSYTLKFADTNDAGDVITETVTYGDDFAAPANLTKTGHVFAGWDVTPPTKIGDMGADKASFTYTAQWTKETYIFHFTNTGDNSVADATVTYGDTYAAPTGLTKTGYNHVGWDPTVPTKIEDMGADKAESTYAAQWEAKKINVNFDANTGVFEDGKTTKAVETEFDGDIKAPAVSKDGYAFVGWSTDPNATTGSNELGKLTTETPATYYAIWSATAANYTVEFWYMNVDGQGYTRADDETITDLSGVVDAPVSYNAAATVTGFVLNTDESTLAGTVPATGTLVLSAYYDRNQYDLTYEGNDAVKVYFDATIPAAVKEPTKEGNYFVKWQNDLTKMPASDLEIAAEWALESYTITFTDLYGNVVEDIGATYGDTITVPGGLVREGYVFAGWKNAKGEALTATIGDLGDNGDTIAYAAQWTLDQFTITIQLDGGNINGDTADVVITKDFGADVEFDATPVKEGHTFSMWSREIPGIMPAEDITITAIWQKNTYTITFNTDGGSEVADITAQYGAAITAPAAPTKDGHVFAGWSEEIPETMPDYGANNAAHEIKATWAKETYTLKFAETGDTAIADKTVTYGDTIEAITGLTKTGHVFAGWDVTPPTEIGDLGADKAVITYTAQWTPETYTLVFADTNDAGESITMPVTFGDTITVPTDLKKTGHTFAGWDVTPPTAIGDLGADKAVLTYTAKWDKITYTVTWIDESGTQTTQVVYGDAIVAPKAATKEGYYFVKWTPDVPATMPADENLEFTALYEVSVYNVNYYVNGAFAVGYSAEYGETIRTENTGYVTPVGYVFDGWYTDAACTTKLAENATVGAEVVNLYAKVTAGTFTANFWLDDAKTQLHHSENVVFDKQILTPDAPTKEGYVFAGWTPYVGLMDEEGKDFVAVWEEKSNITATFYVDGEVYDVMTDLIYGSEMEIPGDPYKKGYRFDGWAVKGTTEIVKLDGTTVPAESVEYEAIFTMTSFAVNYYVYEESEHGPAGTPAPGYIVYTDAEGNAITGSYSLDDAIAHPDAPEIEFYTFSHWEDAEGNVWAEGAAMPAEEITLYAKYDRVAVQLVAQEGSTTVVTRGTASDFSKHYLSGFTGSRLTLSKAKLDSTFVDIVGDGDFTVTPAEGNTRIGTGAIVKVFDNVTGEMVEQFYIVYHGDINGDGRVTAADAANLKAEVASPVWSKRGSQIGYLMEAADLDGNNRISAVDAARLSNAVAGTYTIDQVTGKAE